jgi:hypothetical protein
VPDRQIDSWQEAQAQVASLLEQLNANPALARAAAVNPLYALEELGYEISPRARPEIEERLRFGPRTVVRLQQLREAVIQAAGCSFNLDSATELREVLFDRLKLPVPARQPAQRGRRRTPPDTSPLPPQVSWAPHVEDPLEALRGVHPIMDPLLEYRRLEASEPRLASRALYDEVRQGKRRTPLRRVRGVLKSPPR